MLFRIRKDMIDVVFAEIVPKKLIMAVTKRMDSSQKLLKGPKLEIFDSGPGFFHKSDLYG
jgi:hypothetical protein